MGVFLILDATVLHDETHVLELILGLLVLGIIPAEVVTKTLGG